MEKIEAAKRRADAAARAAAVGPVGEGGPGGVGGAYAEDVGCLGSYFSSCLRDNFTKNPESASASVRQVTPLIFGFARLAACVFIFLKSQTGLDYMPPPPGVADDFGRQLCIPREL